MARSTWGKRRNKSRSIRNLSYFVFMIVVLATTYFIYQTAAKKPTVSTSTNKEVTKKTVSTSKEESSKYKKTKIIFGNSESGRPIEGYVFGNGEDTSLFFGSIHGNEMGTAKLLNQIVDYLAENPNVISSNKRLVVIPIINPDGYYDRTDKLNANEVNLNLNFSTSDWAMYGSEGQYAGPEPWSESESRVLKSVVEKYLPDRMLSYHSNGSLVNPEFFESSQELAWWYATESGYYYYADPAWDYSGTATKWFEETYKKPAITIELNDHLLSDWGMNKKPMLDLLK